MANLARRLTNPGFVRPTLALAAATAALSAGAEILPGLSAKRSIGPLVTGTTVSLLALTAALTQPRARRRHGPAPGTYDAAQFVVLAGDHGSMYTAGGGTYGHSHTTLSNFRLKSDRRTVPRIDLVNLEHTNRRETMRWSRRHHPTKYMVRVYSCVQSLVQPLRGGV